MAAKCMNCSKGVMMGHRVSHSKRRTNHAFKPNLQNKTFVLDGKKLTLRICTNCIKLYKKIDRENKELLSEAAAAAEEKTSEKSSVLN
ncbi:MAG: 50S ribosomal protein L28 [Candidatus Levybacteria bacterium]|nr:50S ribosomal protein L28 [Candidatus Levybacteria bacterium]